VAGGAWDAGSSGGAGEERWGDGKKVGSHICFSVYFRIRDIAIHSD
jgi:hypothetical protein